MAKLHVRLGDNVLVMAGKDNGKTGKVIAADPKTGRVTVEGINIVSKNKKPKNAQDKGGIIKREASIDASNVMIVCPACKKATRVANDANGETKFRKCKKCGASLDSNKQIIKKAAKKSEKKVEDVTKSAAPKKEAKASVSKPATTKKPVAAKNTATTARKTTTTKTAVRKTGDKV